MVGWAACARPWLEIAWPPTPWRPPPLPGQAPVSCMPYALSLPTAFASRGPGGSGKQYVSPNIRQCMPYQPFGWAQSKLEPRQSCTQALGLRQGWTDRCHRGDTSAQGPDSNRHTREPSGTSHAPAIDMHSSPTLLLPPRPPAPPDSLSSRPGSFHRPCQARGSHANRHPARP